MSEPWRSRKLKKVEKGVYGSADPVGTAERSYLMFCRDTHDESKSGLG